MAIGGNRFARAETDLSTLLDNHGALVTITRTVVADVTQRDIFGAPQNYTPTIFQATILVTGQELNELEIIAGGKPREILSFMAAPGVMIENDEIVYGGNTYKVDKSGGTPLGGIDVLEICQATREVVT